MVYTKEEFLALPIEEQEKFNEAHREDIASEFWDGYTEDCDEQD